MQRHKEAEQTVAVNVRFISGLAIERQACPASSLSYHSSIVTVAAGRVHSEHTSLVISAQTAAPSDWLASAVCHLVHILVPVV